jgi:hypothetical protein
MTCQSFGELLSSTSQCAMWECVCVCVCGLRKSKQTLPGKRDFLCVWGLRKNKQILLGGERDFLVCVCADLEENKQTDFLSQHRVWHGEMKSVAKRKITAYKPNFRFVFG